MRKPDFALLCEIENAYQLHGYDKVGGRRKIQIREEQTTQREKYCIRSFGQCCATRACFKQPYTDRKSEVISRDRQCNYFMWHERGTQRDILSNCVNSSSTRMVPKSIKCLLCFRVLFHDCDFVKL